MDAPAFYHALNVLKHGEYRALRKLRERHKDWRACWGSLPRAARARSHPEREWADLERLGIGLVLAGDARFPPLLRHIPHPPFGLYFKGDLSAAHSDPGLLVSIVGTRKATSEGRLLAQRFAASLARAGCAVASGLAFGIDAAAHAGALEAHGRTVAVLAGGLDQVYPAAHARLAEHIIEGGGALISEYPPASPALARRFLERNRIVSGLARAVLIVEAPERSGAIATARYALEQDRDLFVVPGPALHPNYRGSHRLIRNGATLVSDPQELFEDLGLGPSPQAAAAAFDTAEEARIFATLRQAGRPLAIDEIIEAATLTSSVVNRTLTMLIFKNAIREEDGRYHVCS